MICVKCGLDKQPVITLMPGRGTVECCPECGNAHVSTLQVLGMVDTVIIEPSDALIQPAVKKHTPSLAISDTKDILTKLNQRLTFVRSQLADMGKLQSEAAMLERMLAAAERHN